ncbi:signal peptidase I [Paeniglutamicibacter sp. NPDC091659]|uniref:signal peptidase I n=1 Tax=Paeniglutamicibacter sp. NPDC091659 TaxID=3364389 RepID=UPI00381E556E
MTTQQSFEPEGGSDTRQPDTLRVRPLRAAGNVFPQVHYPRRTLHAIGDGFLWLAAIGGFICIGLVIAASVFNISLIMFKTGSMSPTIPAGSVALVREIPASEVGIGDIITVDRPGNLPVTHRVTDIKAVDNGQWSLSMKGDANEQPDPLPYEVVTVRQTLGHVPGLAPVIVSMGSPWVLGSLTLCAAALVTGVFWPRRQGRRVAE